jgi:hypothetical protein
MAQNDASVPAYGAAAEPAVGPPALDGHAGFSEGGQLAGQSAKDLETGRHYGPAPKATGAPTNAYVRISASAFCTTRTSTRAP